MADGGAQGLLGERHVENDVVGRRGERGLAGNEARLVGCDCVAAALLVGGEGLVEVLKDDCLVVDTRGGELVSKV